MVPEHRRASQETTSRFLVPFLLFSQSPSASSLLSRLRLEEVRVLAIFQPLPFSCNILGEDVRTLNKEWEEATNERALEMKLNPITGASILFALASSTLTILQVSRQKDTLARASSPRNKCSIHTSPPTIILGILVYRRTNQRKKLSYFSMEPVNAGHVYWMCLVATIMLSPTPLRVTRN